MENSSHNADTAELAKFSSMAGEWWDTQGAFRTLHEINPLRLEYVRRHAELSGAKLLDVGCGGGLFSEAAANEGAAVTGIDLASANIGAARAHAASGGVSVEYAHASVEEIASARAGAFDVVTCFELLEHVPRPESVVAACVTATRPGGAVFFSTINRNPKSFALAIVAAEHVLRMVPRGTHEYLKLIRPSELAGWSRHAGLDVQELIGLHYNPLLREYSLGGNIDVNYFMYAVKRAE